MLHAMTAAFLLLTAYIAWAPIRFAATHATVRPHPLHAFRASWFVWIIVWGTGALAITLGAVSIPQNLRFLLLFVAPTVLGTALVFGVQSVRSVVARLSLLELVRWQRFRMVGGFFIIGATLGTVPWTFALVAGIGDIFVGLAALATVRAMARVPERSVVLAKRHAWLGLGDFVVAVSTAFATQAQLAWPYALIPLFLVPIAILGHAVTLQRAGTEL